MFAFIWNNTLRHRSWQRKSLIIIIFFSWAFSGQYTLEYYYLSVNHRVVTSREPKIQARVYFLRSDVTPRPFVTLSKSCNRMLIYGLWLIWWRYYSTRPVCFFPFHGLWSTSKHQRRYYRLLPPSGLILVSLFKKIEHSRETCPHQPLYRVPVVAPLRVGRVLPLPRVSSAHAAFQFSPYLSL